MREENNIEIESLQKKIKDLEHKERYSKNPLEKRAIRSQIGQLNRDLAALKKANKNK